jgi:hypothetical protein
MQKRRTNLRLWFLLFVSIFSGQRKSPIILQVSTWMNGQHLEQNNTEANTYYALWELFTTGFWGVLCTLFDRPDDDASFQTRLHP